MRDTWLIILAISLISVICVKEDAPTTAAQDSDAPQPVNPISSVMLDPVACDSSDSGLPEGWAAELTQAGLTKCALPFGVIIGASSEVPDSYVVTVAKIVAELLDPDMDGVANDPAVLELMQSGKNVWLPMPTD